MKGAKRWLIGTAAVLSAAVAGCGVIPGMEGGGTNEAHVGDMVSTSWFDYTVTGAESMDAYEGYAAGEGNKLVVVDLTMTNTFHESVPMFDTDFQLGWGEYADGQAAFPLSPYCGAQLPEKYYLIVDETRAGVLVYEVPEDVQDFTFAFLEVFDNGTEEGEEGDLFMTYLTVD